ncbi:hypothetical protein [Microcoleus sp.]|uniref:hypothetical protein n=1 Tax=Microcoleus sp. TaxID=44472 RepID=UPI0035268D5B
MENLNARLSGLSHHFNRHGVFFLPFPLYQRLESCGYQWLSRSLNYSAAAFAQDANFLAWQVSPVVNQRY